MYAGIDGCKVGWISVRIENNKPLFNIVENLQELDFIFTNNLTLIDIPIGLPFNSRRSCDMEARKVLKPKRFNSVFITPTREAVFANSYEEACENNYRLTGKKISKQAWNICNKIKEVDDFKIKNPNVRLRESHPEVFFWALNNKKPCIYNKKKKEGINERLEILDKYVSGISKELKSFADASRKKHVAIDDIIDAAVLAYAAMLEPDLLIFGNNEKDVNGNSMEIVYPK